MQVLALFPLQSKSAPPQLPRQSPNLGDACSKAAMISCKDREVGSIPTVSIIQNQTVACSPAACSISHQDSAGTRAPPALYVEV